MTIDASPASVLTDAPSTELVAEPFTVPSAGPWAVPRPKPVITPDNEPASTAQIAARTRRTIATLSSWTAGWDTDLTLAKLKVLVPRAAALVVEEETALDKTVSGYKRTGLAYIEQGTYEFFWRFWPRQATPVGAAVRAYLTQTATNPGGSAASAADAAAHEACVSRQSMFRPRDPRLTWQLANGDLVMDELSLKHRGGHDVAHLRGRLLADIVLGTRVAAETGHAFAGVRVLPLRRPASHALLVTAANPDDPDDLTVTPLDHSPLAPAGALMKAGAHR